MAGKREDAMLIVELAKWGSMIGLPEASRTVFSDDFDRDLVLDWLWVSGAWDRVGAAALESRAAAGVTELWENFEALAREQG